MTKSSNPNVARSVLWMVLFMATCALVSLVIDLGRGKAWPEGVARGAVHGAGFGMGFFVVRPMVFDRSTSFLVCGLVPGVAAALTGGLLRVGLNLALGAENWHAGLQDVGGLALAIALVMGLAGRLQMRRFEERPHA